jgi:hypothetical protein
MAFVKLNGGPLDGHAQDLAGIDAPHYPPEGWFVRCVIPNCRCDGNGISLYTEPVEGGLHYLFDHIEEGTGGVYIYGPPRRNFDEGEVPDIVPAERERELVPA